MGKALHLKWRKGKLTMGIGEGEEEFYDMNYTLHEERAFWRLSSEVSISLEMFHCLL